MSGIIPRSFIDELLSRTDLVSLIDSHVPLKKHGSSYVACCPFHHEKTPSFNVVAKKQFYHCFGCGASGNAISFCMSYLNQNFPDAIETLAARAGMNVIYEGSSNLKHKKPTNLYQLLDKITFFYQTQLKKTNLKALDYLKNRGINHETIERFKLGFSPDNWHTLERFFKEEKDNLITTGMLIKKENGKTYDRYRNRIMYPIHDRLGHVVGFGGRSLDDNQKPKYLNSPETSLFQKSHELYGLYQILNDNIPIQNLIVVEGYMDVISLSQYGINNAVATLGTATSNYHIQLLNKYTSKIIFCFDGDDAGKKAAWRALENSLPYLNTGLDINFVFLPNNHDPDSLIRQIGKEGFINHLNNATKLHKFLFNHLLESIDLSNISGKSKFINDIWPYISKIGEGTYQQLIINELSKITQIEETRLKQFTNTKPEEKIPETNQYISRSPTRIAIALLLQNPEIYYTNQEIFTETLINNLKQNTLKNLLLHIATNPNINTGMLLENFRELPEFDTLNKLAAWDHKVPFKELNKECIDTILFLAKQKDETNIKELLDKSRIHGLTKEEQQTLQELLKLKHKNKIIS